MADDRDDDDLEAARRMAARPRPRPAPEAEPPKLAGGGAPARREAPPPAQQSPPAKPAGQAEERSEQLRLLDRLAGGPARPSPELLRVLDQMPDRVAKALAKELSGPARAPAAPAPPQAAGPAPDRAGALADLAGSGGRFRNLRDTVASAVEAFRPARREPEPPAVNRLDRSEARDWGRPAAPLSVDPPRLQPPAQPAPAPGPRLRVPAQPPAPPVAASGAGRSPAAAQTALTAGPAGASGRPLRVDGELMRLLERIATGLEELAKVMGGGQRGHGAGGAAGSRGQNAGRGNVPSRAQSFADLFGAGGRFAAYRTQFSNFMNAFGIGSRAAAGGAAAGAGGAAAGAAGGAGAAAAAGS